MFKKEYMEVHAPLEEVIGTYHQLRADVGRVDYLLADAVNSFGLLSDQMFITVTHALEVYRAELLAEMARRDGK
jgi:hypothetical protein